MDDQQFENIASEIDNAAKERKKIAMFHFQVLKYAHQLLDEDAEEFCKRVRVPESFATEFRKMISLASMIEEQDVVIKWS